jgi:hypothetical protein
LPVCADACIANATIAIRNSLVFILKKFFWFGIKG